MLNKFANELKESREKQSLTLQQISAKSRIDIKFLEAMEGGNFTFLPDLYVKAFLRQYAQNVNLDEKTIIKKYEAAKAGKLYQEDKPAQQEGKSLESIIEDKSPESKPPEEKLSEDKPSEIKRKETKRYVNPPVARPYEQDLSKAPMQPDSASADKQKIYIAAVIIGVIIILGLAYLIFFRGGNNIIVAEKPIEEVIEDAEQRFEEAAPEEKTADQFTPVDSRDSLSLLIQATDTSWVNLFIDNKQKEEFLLFPGSQKLLTAGNNFKITFGKSSAIRLSLNNKPLQFSGRGTPVVHVLINKEGLQYLNAPPTLGH